MADSVIAWAGMTTSPTGETVTVAERRDEIPTGSMCVQYFAAVEPQRRLAPHLHAAIRGAIARELLRQVVRATYVQVWWRPHDLPVYADVMPVWDGSDYVDPDTETVLPTWAEAVDALTGDLDTRPVHVMRFGSQLDNRGPGLRDP